MDCLERSFPLSFSKVTPAIGNSMLFIFYVSGTEDSGAGEAAPESEPEDRAHDKRINPITMQVMPFPTPYFMKPTALESIQHIPKK